MKRTLCTVTHSLSLVAIMSLAACAPQVISSNPRSVVVGAGSELYGPAQSVANDECEKYNRYAVFSEKISTMQWAFNCVD